MNVAVSTGIGCDTTLVEALDRISAVGCARVDLLTIDGWKHVFPSDLVADYDGTVKRLNDELQSRGLTVVATNSGLGAMLHDRSDEAILARSERQAALMRLLNDLEVRVGAIQPLQPDRERPWEEVLTDSVETVREQVQLAAEAGIRFALELHVNSPFETMEQAHRLLEVWPDVPLIYDPTHFVMQGVPLQDTLPLLRNAIHAHCRDAAQGKIQAPFGEGDVDFDWMLGAMKDNGYEGDISIEYLGTQDFDVVDSAKRLLDKLMA